MDGWRHFILLVLFLNRNCAGFVRGFGDMRICMGILCTQIFLTGFSLDALKCCTEVHLSGKNPVGLKYWSRPFLLAGSTPNQAYNFQQKRMRSRSYIIPSLLDEILTKIAATKWVGGEGRP